MVTGYKRARLAIVMEIIAPYRIPVFNHLARCLGDDFLVLFMSAQGGREWTVPVSRLRFRYKLMNGIRLAGGPTDPFPRYLNLDAIRHLKDFAPTLTVIVGYHHPTSYAVWWYAKRWGSKLHLLCESNPLDKRSRRIFSESIKWAFIRTCDGYIVPGKASAAYLKSYGVDEKLIFFAPNSVDTEFFAGFGEADSELIEREFVCLGLACAVARLRTKTFAVGSVDAVILHLPQIGHAGFIYEDRERHALGQRHLYPDALETLEIK